MINTTHPIYVTNPRTTNEASDLKQFKKSDAQGRCATTTGTMQTTGDTVYYNVGRICDLK